MPSAAFAEPAIAKGGVGRAGFEKGEIGRRRRQALDFIGNRQGINLEFLRKSLEKFGISLEKLGFSLERLGKIWPSSPTHTAPCMPPAAPPSQPCPWRCAAARRRR